MPIILGNVLNWYKYDARFSIELMRSFVQGTEKLAAQSILDWKRKKDERDHQGLDEETWPLKEIFEEYFPSLQRRSALLTLCGFFEHELEKLCTLYKTEKGFGLASSDLKDKGID